MMSQLAEDPVYRATLAVANQDIEMVGEVKVRLMFQSVSWEYVKFLAEENHTEDWGKKLFDVWDRTGQCAPSEMASARAQIRH